jgi:hypothetical protein
MRVDPGGVADDFDPSRVGFKIRVDPGSKSVFK